MRNIKAILWSLLLLVVAGGMLNSQTLGQGLSKKQRRLVGPDYSPPSVAVGQNWIDYNRPDVISAAYAVDDMQWWNVFGDAEISKIVAAANQSNLTLQSALHRIEQLSRQRSIAVGNLFPQQQEFFAEYQRIQFSDNGNQLGIAGLGNNFNLNQLGFNASWEIDLWGRIRRSVEAATAELHASAEDERDIRLILTANVITAYTEIRTYQQRIQNAYEQIEAAEKTLEIAKSKFRNGSVSQLDVSQAEATLAEIRSRVPRLESNLRVSNNQLCLLLGIPPRDLTVVMGYGQIPYATGALVVGLPRDLLRRRPDIRRAERIVAQQSALIGVAKADLFPTFSLRGTINWQSFSTSNLISSGSNAGSIIPGLRWDIFNYSRIKNQVKVQEARFKETVAAYRQAVLSANTEVENALNGYLNKKVQLEFLEEAVQATRDSVAVGQKQYEAGTIEFDRLNDLRKELVNQLDGLAVERGQAAQFLIQVYRTMGGGWAIPAQQFCDKSHAHPSQGFVQNSNPATQMPPSQDFQAQPAARSRFNSTLVAAEQPAIAQARPTDHPQSVPVANGDMPNLRTQPIDERRTLPDQVRQSQPSPNTALPGPVVKNHSLSLRPTTYHVSSTREGYSTVNSTNSNSSQELGENRPLPLQNYFTQLDLPPAFQLNAGEILSSLSSQPLRTETANVPQISGTRFR